MANRQFLVGFTHRLQFDFRDEIGDPTGVDSPRTRIYTPDKNIFLDEAPLTPVAGTCNSFTRDFFATPGLTVGQWFAIGTGLTQPGNAMIMSDQFPFEIVDLTIEPFWISLDEYRVYLDIPSTDHSRDRFHKQMLQTSMQLIEDYTQRKFGLQVVNQTIEVVNTQYVKLNCFPVANIVALTVQSRIIPRSLDNLFSQTLTGSQVSFFFRLDAPAGIIIITDENGYNIVRDDMIMTVTYQAGFASVPEPIRTASLQIASQLSNLACNEGYDSVRLSDMSFTPTKSLFKGVIGDMLRPYRNVGFWESALNRGE